MSEIGEMWAERKAGQQLKRAKNAVSSAEMLEEASIPFKSYNCGVHLVLDCGAAGIVDFWPSTGLFRPRNGGEGRGVKNLIKVWKRGNGT